MDQSVSHNGSGEVLYITANARNNYHALANIVIDGNQILENVSLQYPNTTYFINENYICFAQNYIDNVVLDQLTSYSLILSFINRNGLIVSNASMNTNIKFINENSQDGNRINIIKGSLCTFSNNITITNSSGRNDGDFDIDVYYLTND